MKTTPAISLLNRVGPLGWAAIIAGVYLVFCLLTLDNFGITWDEPVHFRAADFYLDSIMKNGLGARFEASDFGHGMENYGPFFDILASLSRISLAGKTDRLQVSMKGAGSFDGPQLESRA